MKIFDVVIIGGSFAGLSAALPLLRARKQVLIIDMGQRRNRFAQHSHNFLTQDGHAPEVIIQVAKEQLDKYSTLSWLDGEVIDVKPDRKHYQIQTIQSTGLEEVVITQKVIIATGVKDVLPNVDGLVERWGKSVLHCPYCDGYELNLGRIGMLVTNLHSVHMALMLPDWGDTTLFLNGVLDENQVPEQMLLDLKRRQVKIDNRKVLRVQEYCDVVFDNGEVLKLDGLFVSTYMQLQADWINRLGLEIDVNEYGEAIKTTATKQTNLVNVFACGDVARSGNSVALAVGDGTLTGVSVHKSFIFNQ